MNEYISREEIVSEIRSRVSIAEDLQEIGYNTAMGEMMQWVKHIPAADVEPVRHGRWIIDTGCGEYGRCSECKGKSGTQWDGVEPIPRLTVYCPSCGAKMDGGAEQ